MDIYARINTRAMFTQICIHDFESMYAKVYVRICLCFFGHMFSCKQEREAEARIFSRKCRVEDRLEVALSVLEDLSFGYCPYWGFRVYRVE